MSKAVLISIQPQWCELIANEIKTLELRKTRPKLEPPFKCYIYCTIPKSSGDIYLVGGENPVQGNGCVIGEFICNKISEYEAEFHKDNNYYQDIREIFRDDDNPDDDCRDFHIITSNDEYKPDNCKLCWESCLTFEEIKKYIGKDDFCLTFYGWNISDLKIYDKPRELAEFGKARPPQSWCYVEEI